MVRQLLFWLVALQDRKVDDVWCRVSRYDEGVEAKRVLGYAAKSCCERRRRREGEKEEVLVLVLVACSVCVCLSLSLWVRRLWENTDE